MITFNARGTKFSIPKSLLKKYPDTLLNNICIHDNIPVDMINGGIFVDINPSNISAITDIYHYHNLNEFRIKSISQYMDLRFVGFDVEYNKILPYMTEPISCDNLGSHDPTTTQLIDEKIICINIHTLENNVISIHKNITYDWIECHFKSIILGKIDDYIIDHTDNTIDVWIGLNAFKTHYLLSILRDGLNYYYYDYPLKYIDNMDNISCDFNTDDITSIIKHDYAENPIYIHGCNEYIDNNVYIDKSEHDDYFIKFGSFSFMGKSLYHKLKDNRSRDCDISHIVALTDYNFELSNTEIKNIINNVNTLGNNHKKITKCVIDLKNLIAYNRHIFNVNDDEIHKYHITDKLLYFFGLLNDNIKKQLDERIQLANQK